MKRTIKAWGRLLHGGPGDRGLYGGGESGLLCGGALAGGADPGDLLRGMALSASFHEGLAY